ncbi:hypothetical protein QJS10_CPB21g00517 [Acorus calamus]|uniref:MBD domain-containing protein n=1 Tax=Acorus calamus TaxID=4465 RepID=A0AAV9C2V1_ACOCL|nr:hypothetical protein QJS10_CPB21g00517 [Acorus calamus]
MAVEKKPEWLPNGWIVEVRRKSSGVKYKCYVDPVTRTRFYSKPQVLRHLSFGDLEIPSSECKKARVGIPSNNVISQFEHSPDGLPPGWIKEIKFRNHSQNPQRKDQYYIDPVNGYIFRSMKSVFHYLNTGKIDKHVCKPNQIENVNSVDNKLSRSAAVKRQKLRGTSASRCLLLDRGSNSSANLMEDNCEPPKEESCIPGSSNASYAQSKTLQKMELTGVKPLDIANEDPCQLESKGSMDVMKETLSQSQVKQMMEPYKENQVDSASPSDGPSEKLPETIINEESFQRGGKKSLESAKEELSQPKLKHPVEEKLCEPFSKRSCSSNEKHLVIADETLDPSSDIKEKPSSNGDIKQQQKRKAKDKTQIYGPRRASKRLAGIEADLQPDYSICDRALRKGSAQQTSQHKVARPSEPTSSNLTLEKDEKADPCIGVGDVPGSPISFPFGDSWPDPCIEFAFKTLTCATPPVLEDVSLIEDFFNQHLTSAQGPGSSNSPLVPPNMDNGFQKFNMYQVEMQEKRSISSGDITPPCFSGGKLNK